MFSYNEFSRKRLSQLVRADSAVPFAQSPIVPIETTAPRTRVRKLVPEILEESQPRRQDKVQSNFIFKPAPWHE